MRIAVVGALCAVAALALLSLRCDEGEPVTTSSGGGGEGGACPTMPQALFTLVVTAADGPVPNDTTLQVRWSAGDEPLFDLADPSTWRSLDDGANVTCDVGPEPAGELATLTCELWTSGATEIEIAATNYVTHVETLVPRQQENCDTPVPSEVEVELPRDHDAGVAD